MYVKVYQSNENRMFEKNGSCQYGSNVPIESNFNKSGYKLLHSGI